MKKVIFTLIAIAIASSLSAQLTIVSETQTKEDIKSNSETNSPFLLQKEGRYIRVDEDSIYYLGTPIAFGANDANVVNYELRLGNYKQMIEYIRYLINWAELNQNGAVFGAQNYDEVLNFYKYSDKGLLISNGSVEYCQQKAKAIKSATAQAVLTALAGPTYNIYGEVQKPVAENAHTLAESRMNGNLFYTAVSLKFLKGVMNYFHEKIYL